MISIIIPVYNTANYIDKCIESVLNQTYKDIEIIIIDDCSTDGSSERIDYWAKRDSRISAFHKDFNKGVSDSRNVGLSMARGEYVGFVDSDDWIEPEMYDSLLGILKKNEADIAFGGYNRITPTGVITKLPNYQQGEIITTEEALSHCIPQRNAGIYDLYIWDKLYKKDSLMENNTMILFDTGISYSEDVLWLIKVLLNCKGVACFNKALYNYRIGRIGNACNELMNYKNIEFYEQAYRTNLMAFMLLAQAGSLSANNAYQRVLVYQKYAIITSLKTGDYTNYKRYTKGYSKGVIDWFVKNRTWIGLKWTARQLGTSLLYSLHSLSIYKR